MKEQHIGLGRIVRVYVCTFHRLTGVSFPFSRSFFYANLYRFGIDWFFSSPSIRRHPICKSLLAFQKLLPNLFSLCPCPRPVFGQPLDDHNKDLYYTLSLRNVYDFSVLSFVSFKSVLKYNISSIVFHPCDVW